MAQIRSSDQGSRHRNDLRLTLQLWTSKVLGRPDREAELDVIERYGSPEQRHVAELFRASSAATDETIWCAHVSRYIAQFDLSPLAIPPGTGSRFARLTATPSSVIADGPKVSVIMAAYNAEETIGWAAASILAQTWRNLDVIIVDDASTDRTWVRLNEIAAKDPRVRILRNSVNIGPFVSRNRALPMASGAYLTGHDADDWAHPQRIERQFQRLQAAPGAVGITSQMLRLGEDLRFRHFAVEGRGLLEEPTRLHPMSSLFEARPFHDRLGYWDCVRFSGDGELLKRAQAVFGSKVLTPPLVTNLSLDRPTSIMNDPVHGRSHGRKRSLSPTRVAYRASYTKWHKTMPPDGARLAFPPTARPFPAPPAMSVEAALIGRLLAADGPEAKPSPGASQSPAAE